MVMIGYSAAAVLAAAGIAQAHMGCDHQGTGPEAALRRREAHEATIRESNARRELAEAQYYQNAKVRRQAAPAAAGAAAPAAAPASAIQNWQQQKSIQDPAAECTYYYNADVTNLIKTVYPPIWQTANLSNPNTPQSIKDLYNTLSAQWPEAARNMAPRGNRYGDFTGVQYNYGQDPDCWWTGGPAGKKCDTPKIPNLRPDVISCPEPLTYGHTIDDGPNCTHNSYYDFLAQHQVKSTLFFIGSNLVDWPYQGQRGLAEGHEICSHTWSHPYMTSMTNEEAFAELHFSQRAIQDILNITVQCWRPPYGDVDDRIRAIAASLGMRTVVWEADTFDYKFMTIGLDQVQQHYDAIIEMGKNGTFNNHGPIVLSHELTQETMDMMMKNLPSIQQVYTGGVMGVAFCQNNSRPYVEKNYVYPNYAQYASGTRTIQIPTVPTTIGGDNPLAYASSSVYVSANGIQTGTPAITAQPTAEATSLPNAAAATGGSNNDDNGGYGATNQKSNSDAKSTKKKSSAPASNSASTVLYTLCTFGALVMAAVLAL